MPLKIPGLALDYYLSQGYYRMRQNLFTCQFLPQDDQLYTVHWLRLTLSAVAYGPRQRQLLRQNVRFSVAVRPFALTAEYEELYARYYQALAFDASPTLAELLLEVDGPSIFTTEIIEIRDGHRLIAAGIFDQGALSIAGIVNFYDPGYRKYSLGKYLLLCKIAHAQKQGNTYYYPGYLAHGYPKFDYKLWACPTATEVFNCRTGHWLPFSWEEVAAQSAGLLADWAAQRLANEAG